MSQDIREFARNLKRDARDHKPKDERDYVGASGEIGRLRVQVVRDGCPDCGEHFTLVLQAADDSLAHLDASRRWSPASSSQGGARVMSRSEAKAAAVARAMGAGAPLEIQRTADAAKRLWVYTWGADAACSMVPKIARAIQGVLNGSTEATGDDKAGYADYVTHLAGFRRSGLMADGTTGRARVASDADAALAASHGLSKGKRGCGCYTCRTRRLAFGS